MSVFFDVETFYHEFVKNILSNLNHFSKKIICFDYGTHKIGLSVSDDNLQIAFPKNILTGNWLNIQNAITVFLDICKKYNSNFIVIGLPKNLDNTLNANCERIITIAENLNKNNINTLLFDERFSTKQAHIIGNFSKKNNDDATASYILLSDVLKIISAKNNCF